MAGTIRCRLGLHRWDKGRCVRIRVCLDCGEKQFLRHGFAPHQWRDPVFEGNSCDLVAVCSACGERKTAGRRHDWGPWTADAVPCAGTRTCARCGSADSRESHKREEWKTADGIRCEEGRVCADCGRSETRERHSWGPWTSSDGGHTRHCRKNPDHSETEPHRLNTRVDGRSQTIRGGGACIDPGTGFSRDLDITVTEEIVECRDCDYRESREIGTTTEEVGRL